MKSTTRIFYLLVLVCTLVLAGCGGRAPVPETNADVGDPMPSEEMTPSSDDVSDTPTIQPVVESAELSDQPYLSPSGAFQLTLPEGWNCSEQGDYQVNCQSPDQSAALQAAITGTGYELVQDAFLSSTHAELVYTYSEIKDYIETSRSEDEGILRVTANWRSGETYYQSTNLFIRSTNSIFHLYTESIQDAGERYADLFSAVADSAEITSSALNDRVLYSQRFEYTAPDVFFSIKIPVGWGKFVDGATVENTILEGFLSPDKRAAVQTAVYRRGSLIEQSLKGEKTLEIMRAIYGYDLRVSHDKALPDGRERLAWYAKRKDINGISYFDSYGSSLYVFSIVWETPTQDIYLPVLEEIEASFERK